MEALLGPLLTPCPAPLHRDPAHAWNRRQLIGTAVRVARGAYVAGAEWDALSPWERHRVVVEAWHAHAPGAVLGAGSALAALGLPVLLDPGVVNLVQGSGAARHSLHRVVRGGRTIASYRVRRETRPWASRSILRDGYWSVESPLEAAVYLASQPGVELGAAVVAIDGAWRASGDETYARERMDELTDALRSRAAKERVAAALELASPLSESAAESLARIGIQQLGYASPVEQLPLVLEGRLLRPDFTWPELKLVLEVDGAIKYAGADEASVRREEKLRQAILVRAGYRVVRVEWADVTHPERLRAILRTLGVPPAT